MRLKHDWKYIAARAWSMRLAILTAVSGSFPLFVTSVSPLWFAALTMMLAVLTAVTRVTDQPGMDRRKQDIPTTPDRRE